MKIRERYKLNKEAKVGDSCVCPSCGSGFVKNSYQQAFCKTRTGMKCKDKYWNTVTPEKRNNTTRISPANAAWMARQERKRDLNGSLGFDPHDCEHPCSGAALGQWDDC